jgi:hypothetical protein
MTADCKKKKYLKKITKKKYQLAGGYAIVAS